MKHGILVVIFGLAAQVSSQEQSCQTNNDLPWFGSPLGDTFRLGQRTQVIITEDSFMFNCHGNVTEWGVDLYPSARYTIALQVWREIGRSRYSSVGANTLTTSAQGIVTLDLRETPASQIQVQPGDLIGFSVIQAPTHTDGGIIIDRSASAPATYAITSDTRVNEATLRLDSTSGLPPVISVSVEISTSPILTSTPAMTSSPSPTTTRISSSSLIPTPSLPTEFITVVLVSSESTEYEDLTTTRPPEVSSSSSVSLIVGIVLALLLFMVILGGAITIVAVFILRKRNHHAYSTQGPGISTINKPIDQSLNSIEMKKNIVYGISSTQPEMDMTRNEAYGVTSTGGESLERGLEVSYDYVNEGLGPLQQNEPEYDYIDH